VANEPQNNDSTQLSQLTQRELEAAKMAQDTLKHITTVSTSAVVLVTSAVSAFFPKPESVILLVVCITLLLGATALAMTGLSLINNNMTLREDFQSLLGPYAVERECLLARVSTDSE
jgi:hypothetical protein